jgi:hypothetical protein
VAEKQDTGRSVLTVRPAADSGTFPEVKLTGTQNGLVWLAEQILRVAHADLELHTHLDAEACGPIYVSPGGWWLTLTRSEKLQRGMPAEPQRAPDRGGRERLGW